MQRYHVGAAQQIFEGNQLDVELARGGLGDVRVVSQNFHFEGASAAGHFGAYAAEADEAKRLAAQFHAGGRFFPAAGLDGGVGLRHRAREGQHQRESVFGDADGVATGSVHHQDAAVSGGVHVHIIDANSGAAYDAEAVGFVEEFGGDAGGAADDEAVSVGDFGGERSGGGENNLPAGFAEELDAALADFVRDDDFHSGKPGGVAIDGDNSAGTKNALRGFLNFLAICTKFVSRIGAKREPGAVGVAQIFLGLGEASDAVLF